MITGELMDKHISIAVDGPSGAGKSTIARRTAREFGIIYVDTGAIYRTVGLAVQRAGISSHDEKAVAALLPDISIDMAYDGRGEQRMLLGGGDVSDEIRTPQSSIYASDVSAMPQVRGFLLDMQREMARKNDVIMDGRDIGTVVLPDAGLKIFLTASPYERARRRCDELLARGENVSLDEVLHDIEYRDLQDSTRELAPLKAAQDSVTVDTTGLSFDDSFREISSLVKSRFGL